MGTEKVSSEEEKDVFTLRGFLISSLLGLTPRKLEKAKEACGKTGVFILFS